jgi:nucleoid DNA-binding protein/nucleoid-associated protein YgaU
MSDKINQQFFVDYIAEHHKMNRADAEKFVNTFFSVIVEALHTDNVVKIKGLGTFKLIDVESRESMNIHSGERFVIERYTKVSFTPDASLRDVINRPFEHFETVLLKDGVSFSDVSEVEGDGDDDNTLDDEPDTSVAESEVVASPKPVVPSADSEETPTAVAVPAVAVIPESEAAAESETVTAAPEKSEVDEAIEQIETPVDESPIEEVEESPAAVVEPSSVESEEAADDVAKDAPAAETEESPAESEEVYVDESGTMAADESESIVEKAENDVATEDDPLQKLIAEAVEEKRKRESVVAGMYTQKHDKETGSTYNGGKNGSGRGMKILTNCVLCVVVLAVIICGYYVAKMYFPELFDDDNVEYNANTDSTIDDFRQIALVDTVMSEPDTLVADSFATETINEDSLNAVKALEDLSQNKDVKPVAVKEVRVEKPAVDNAKPSTPVASGTAQTTAGNAVGKSAINAPVHPDSVNYKVVGTKATHILQPGETLTRVSLKFYGTKDLYPYIVNYNRNVILDPNNVPVGTTLRIPELVKK